MKRFVVSFVLLSALSFTLVRCKLDNESYVKQSMDLNLTSWNLPNEAKVSTPFNLDVRSLTENSCYGKIVFRIENNLGKDYVFAQSVYYDKGGSCSALATVKDSTISITKSQTGKYYYYFLKDNKWNKDSIVIIP